MKKKIQVLLIIVITISCIFLGINTRKSNAIAVTQLKTVTSEGLSYLIETKENNLIMIDGGGYDDSKYLEEVLAKKGGVVDTWFVTIAHWQNFGALQRIIENGKIQINHIYLSFNTVDWYQKYEPDRAEQVAQFLDLIYNGAYMSKVQDIPNRFEVKIDNLYLTALNVKNPELNGNYAGFNQSMVLKVNNTYKSMIFMGNIANEAAQKFKDNNLDEINCDAVQVSNNGMQMVKENIYQEMTPNYIFSKEENDYIRNLQKSVGAEKIITDSGEDKTTKIW